MGYIKKEMQERRAKYARMNKLSERIEADKKEMERIRDDAWHKRVIERLGERLRKHGKWHTVEISGPFGIGAEVSVTLKQYRDGIGDETNLLLERYATFEVHKDDLYLRDYRTNTGKYKADTIGALNGMNHPMIKVTDLSIPALHELIEEIN